MSARTLRTTVCLAGLALAACSRAEPDPRPSVILVSIDTLRADHLGLYGYERDTSPFLDRFGRDAIVYEHAFTPATWTLIAHMTMLTGLYPNQHGVTEERVAVAHETPLLAERLKADGYHTVGLYYPGWVHPRHGFGRGFDVFRPHESAEEAAEHLAQELDGLEDGRPYFLFVHLFDVHSGPFQARRHTIYPSPEPFQDQFMEDAEAILPDMDEVALWESENLLDAPQIEALTALYDGGIRHVDTRLSEWFGELERRGLLANTLVIITADHGESLQQRGRISGHGGFWQEGLHVPLIVRPPDGSRAGQRVEAPVHLGDIVPTVLATLGLAPDANLPGRSLLGPLPDERVVFGSRPPREYVVRWPVKILKSFDEKYFGGDLAADPGELKPQFVPRAMYDELRAQALGPERTWPAPLSIDDISEDDKDALRALGYAGELDDSK